MFYKKKNKKKNQIIFQNKFGISFWTAVLFLAVFLNTQDISISACNAAASGITSEKLFELTNQSRTEQGIEKLTINQNLISAANSKARDMFKHNYFAHTSPQGIDPWYWIRQAGYSYQYAGENLAMDFVTSAAVHKALIASATHRKNILNPNYKEIGIAVLSGNFEGRQTIIVVQTFGAVAQIVKEEKPIVNSNPTVAKKPTVASASIDINKSPAAEKINKPVISNNNLVELKKKELASFSGNNTSLNFYQNKRALILPVELDKKLSFSAIPSFPVTLCPSVISTKAGIHCLNSSLSIWIPDQVGNDEIYLKEILEINSNGRIKNVFKNNENNFIEQHSFVILNLFQNLFQDFNCHINRFRNLSAKQADKFGMKTEFFSEIPEYLSCFLLGGKIDAYVK
jgi:uncharacterized protein YkwD